MEFDQEILAVSKLLIQEINKDSSKIVQAELQDNEFLGSIQLIHQACKAFYQFLTQEILTDTRNKKNDSNEYIIKLGTVLLFQLRKFVVGEEIEFVIAGTVSGDVLKESTYSQDQIFSLMGLNNFRVSFSNAQIELSHQIEGLKNLKDADLTLAGQWSKILKYGFVKNYKAETKPISSNKDGAFHKNTPDINVYLKFTNGEKRRSITYYYMLNGENPRSRDELKQGKAYDRGWMYQWLKMNQGIEINDLSLTPLHPLMSAEESVREHVAGIRGGDFGSEQYKYRNRRVITLNNMKDILNGSREYIGLIPSLEKLIANINTPNQAFGDLVKDFTTKNENEIAAFVKDRLDSLLPKDLT